jgi:hypothetical protein
MKSKDLTLTLYMDTARRQGEAIRQISQKHKSRGTLPFGNVLPLLWMWGVKEKDMALYKLREVV